MICDADIELTGTPFVGDCLGCDFAFDVDAVITRDDGTTDCEYNPALTYLETGFPGLEMSWAFWSSFYGYADTLGGFYRYGSDMGYFYFIYDGSYYGEANRTGDVVDWWFSYEYQNYEWVQNPPDLYCGTYSGTPLAGPGAATPTYGTLPCIAYTYVDPYSGRPYTWSYLDGIDVWKFDAEAGQIASVTVDTVDTTTTFDARMRLIDPSACDVIDNYSYTKGTPYPGPYGTYYDYWYFGDDDFECSFRSRDDERCPGWEVETDKGTYQVVIGGNDYDCLTDAKYALRVQLTDSSGTATEPALTLDQDNADEGMEIVLPGVSYEVFGTATIK